MEYIKEDLEKLILVDKIPYEKIGRLYNVTGAYIKKKAKQLEIVLPVKLIFPEGFIPHNKNTGKAEARRNKKVEKDRIKAEKALIVKIPKTVTVINCTHCGNVVNSRSLKTRFCSHQCHQEHGKIDRYKSFLKGELVDYCGVKKFKPQILKEQNNCCVICGINNIWNNKTLTFVLDHIDGRANNNKRDNLRLLCHNCDSQLDTYKSKNKNSDRKDRYFLNYKN